jgi:hypothetical protein
MHGYFLFFSGSTMAALTGWALAHDKTIFEFSAGAIFNLGSSALTPHNYYVSLSNRTRFLGV